MFFVEYNVIHTMDSDSPSAHIDQLAVSTADLFIEHLENSILTASDPASRARCYDLT
jgi:hypothetical protein